MRIRVANNEGLQVIKNVRSACQYSRSEFTPRVSYILNSDSPDAGLHFANGTLVDAEEERNLYSDWRCPSCKTPNALVHANEVDVVCENGHRSQ
jgi:hypothetical protein